MNRTATRGLVIAGWLLTPVAAWAVAFLGGWLGAALGGSGGRSGVVGFGMLGVGAVLGAVVGAVGWIVAMRAVTTYLAGRAE